MTKQLRIYYLDIYDKRCAVNVSTETWGTPHEVAYRAAAEGFSVVKAPETEGQLDYYPPHRVLKVVVL